MENNLIKLRGYVTGTAICNEENFKIYPFIPSLDYMNLVRLNKYNNISIVGDIPELMENIEYIAELEYSKKGNYENYIVHKIYIPKPTTEENTRKFLNTIIKPNQTDVLLDVYPDIIDRIMNNKEIDLSLTKGIKEYTFNKIKNKIIENFCLMELIDEYADYGMTIAMLKKLHDSYTSIEKIREAMQKSPYECLCKINRVAFKTADKIILKKLNHMLNSKQRMKACIDYLLKQNESEGHTLTTINELQKKCEELALESMSHFINIITTDENIYFDKINKKIARKKAYDCEKTIAKILKGLNRKNPLNINYKKYNFVNGFKLSETQMDTLKNFCTYNLTLLEGWAGTGKSASTKALIDLMDENNMSYILLSPTGKASKVLAEYTKRPASTIHRGLGYSPQEGGFHYNFKNKLPYDVVIVDEFSMVDIYLMKSLLSAIDVNHTRVLFIQDPSQIPSVQAGNVSYDMIQSKIIPTTTLTEVFRYGEGGLATIATKTRMGEKFLEDTFSGIKTFGLNKDFVLLSMPQEKSLSYIVSIYKKIYNQIKNLDDITVLSAYNVGQYGTININNIIQNIINPKSQDKEEIIHKQDKEEIIFREGDKVIQIKNNYNIKNENDEDSEIFNGNTGIIKKIVSGVIYIDFDGEVLKYNKSDLRELQLGYAISIHKSQGSQSKYIIVATPKAHKHFLNRNLLYVAYTRAKKTVYNISTPDVIASSLKKEETIIRNTWLLNLLKDEAIIYDIKESNTNNDEDFDF